MKEMPVNAERAAILLWLHNFQLLKLHLRIIAKSIILVGNALDEAILELFDYLLIIESEINRKTTDPSEFPQVEKMMMISNGKTAKREMGREAIKESDLVSDSDIETDGHVSKKFVQRGGTNAKAVHGESLKMKESEMTSRQEQTMILLQQLIAQQSSISSFAQSSSSSSATSAVAYTGASLANITCSVCLSQNGATRQVCWHCDCSLRS